jgi:hypothetical protein
MPLKIQEIAQLHAGNRINITETYRGHQKKIHFPNMGLTLIFHLYINQQFFLITNHEK